MMGAANKLHFALTKIKKSEALEEIRGQNKMRISVENMSSCVKPIKHSQFRNEHNISKLVGILIEMATVVLRRWERRLPHFSGPF